MRVLSITALAIVIILVAMSLPSAPRATSSLPEHLTIDGVTIDPGALQSTIDVKSLPEQITGDPM